MFCLITGWIIELGTGIAGLVFSIMQKKEMWKNFKKCIYQYSWNCFKFIMAQRNNVCIFGMEGNLNSLIYN